MFFEYTSDGIRETSESSLSEERLTAGYMTAEELEKLNSKYGFDSATVEACRDSNRLFRSGVEVHRDYTFTELRIMNAHEEADDYVALYLKKNAVLIVDIEDADGSTKNKFLSSVNRYTTDTVCCEKLIYAFIDSLLSGDHTFLETVGNDLSEQEDAILSGKVGNDLNEKLLGIKKMLSKRQIYYEQLLDITDAVCENDNGIFKAENLIYIDNLTKRISRLRDGTSELRSTVEHLQDAYSSYLDIKMNNTMKIFTVLTSIFFPLTIIVGWYGMNFRHMPELAWRYGYIYVILLSVITVLVLVFIGKKKKWF